MAREKVQGRLLIVQGPFETQLGAGAAWRDARWQPRIDVYQGEQAISIQVEAPGLDEDQLRLRFDSGHLIIEGVRPRPVLDGPRRCLQMEIEHGPFRRVLSLPPEIDAARIEARYQSGLLSITIPRRTSPPNASTRINID